MIDSHHTVVYEPGQKEKISFLKLWPMMMINIIESKELIWQLFRRDFLMTYQKSFLGKTWILISPLIGIVSWVFMNAIGVLTPGEVGIPYPAYVLVSTLIWGLFMGFYSASAETLNAGSGFILQVKYPHEALLMKQTGQHLANFSLGFVINLVVLVAFGVIPSWKIVFFPLMMIPLFLLGSGVGLVLSVVSVVASDIRKGVDFLMGLLFYATPVIYSSNIENHYLQKVMKYNPLTYLFGNLRDLILYGKFENTYEYTYSCILSLFIFMIAWKLFFVSEGKAIEKMI